MKFNKANDQEIQGTTAPIAPSDFDEFDDVDMGAEFSEESDTKSIPFAQLCTTSVDLTRFAAMPDPAKDYPYGLFIPLSQAEKAGFVPDENWMIEYPNLGGKVRKFGGDNATAGYFVKPGKMCRMLILASSQQEVYADRQFNGKQTKACLGPYLSGFNDDGQPIKSEAGLQFDAAPKNTGWQNSQRYLFYIVGENNEPLSDRPFSLRISNAFGIGFKSELKLNTAEMIAASKAHSEMHKAKAIASAEAAKATAIKSGNVQGGIDAEAALKAARRTPARSLSRKDSARFVFVFTQAMRENKDGIGTCYISGRCQPSIWESGKKPTPFQIDRTKKNGETIYSIAIAPTAYNSVFVKATSDFGEQIAADLLTYSDFKIAPNLRKQLTEAPQQADTRMPDFEEVRLEDEYTYEEEEAPTGLEADDSFNRILLQLAKAVSVDQVKKWKVWALKPAQKGSLEEDYPDYDTDLDALAAKHLKTLTA